MINAPHPHQAVWDTPEEATADLVREINERRAKGHVFRAVELSCEREFEGFMTMRTSRERWHVFIRSFPVS